jgi:hypothetical protein
MRKFLVLARFARSNFDSQKTHAELFEARDDSPSEPINSPPTPPPEFIDAESIATDFKAVDTLVPLPNDTKEGDTIDLGKRDRIVCTHITSPLGRSTRYLIIDPWRVILVAPDITKPGCANIRLIVPLRMFSSITVSKEDQRILLLETPTSKEQLGFDDVKRCHLALMQLETKRIDIRKAIYRRLDDFFKQSVHP